MVPHLYTTLLVVLSLHLDPSVAECECGKNNLEKRIVGGNESQVHEWPWQVALVINITEQLALVLNISESQSQFCGGSLISQSWVLSAAHCFDNDKWSLKQFIKRVQKITYVSIGEHELYTVNDTSHTEHHYINRIILHDHYSKLTFDNDIAVIQLSQPVEYSHAIRPVCLPTNLRTQLFDGEDATATGWGHTSHNGSSSNVNLEVHLQVISNTKCEEIYHSLGYEITDKHVCTYTEGKDTCQGDSGGPLVWLGDSGRYQQIGIVSWGEGCAWKHRPSVYTRVTSYIDWIQEKTKTSFCSP